ncbi:MAG: hypothetical protein K0R24_1959 [Gammaproteobacteria bacterium]|nr:hypothetical protein [Gammaproteobacteria bacterium]
MPSSTVCYSFAGGTACAVLGTSKTSPIAVGINRDDVAFRALWPGGGNICPSLAVKNCRDHLSVIFELPATSLKLVAVLFLTTRRTAMKLKIITTFITVMVLANIANATQRTNGYVRKNGTYVAPYVSTSPNSSRYDNYSTKGNINPYTGKSGYVNPYKNPTGTYRPQRNSNYNNYR